MYHPQPLPSTLAASVTATLLGNLGAEVVKIEEPAPQVHAGEGDSHMLGRRSLQWAQEVRSNESVVIDLHEQSGRERLKGLIPESDLVVTNYRPPSMQRWGSVPKNFVHYTRSGSSSSSPVTAPPLRTTIEGRSIASPVRSATWPTSVVIRVFLPHETARQFGWSVDLCRRFEPLLDGGLEPATCNLGNVEGCFCK
jgi:hypothetical protein